MADKYESIRQKNKLCFPIYLCSKEITRRYAPILSELDLTYTQYIVMMYLWEEKSANVKKIGESLLLDPSTLTPLLKKLEQKGYISRARKESDERNLIIELTEKGDNLKDKALFIPEQMGRCIDLSEDEVKLMYKLTYKILNNIEKEQ